MILRCFWTTPDSATESQELWQNLCRFDESLRMTNDNSNVRRVLEGDHVRALLWTPPGFEVPQNYLCAVTDLTAKTPDCELWLTLNAPPTSELLP